MGNANLFKQHATKVHSTHKNHKVMTSNGKHGPRLRTFFLLRINFLGNHNKMRPTEEVRM